MTPVQILVQHYLLKKCYPRKLGSGPKSTDLARIVRYTEAKPKKRLLELSKWIERKIRRDEQGGRSQNHRISLDILNTILRNCRDGVEDSAQFILGILEIIAENQDLLPQSSELFVLFMRSQASASILSRAVNSMVYNRLISKFSLFGVDYSDDMSLRLKRRLFGLRVLFAAITSDVLYTTRNLPELLEPILNTVLTNLMEVEVHVNRLRKKLASKEAVPNPSEDADLRGEDLQLLALHALNIFFKKASTVMVRKATPLLFNFLDHKDRWWPSSFPVDLVQILLAVFQEKHFHILVNETMQRLAFTRRHGLTTRQASYVAVLASILHSNCRIHELNILEMLKPLLECLTESLRGRASRRNISLVKQQHALENNLHQNLVRSIGALALHDGNVDQIIGHLLPKLRSNSPLEEVDGVPITEIRRTYLHCLRLAVTTYHKSAVKQRGFQIPGIELERWIPTLSLCLEKDFSIRMEYVQTLLTVLESMSSEMEPAIVSPSILTFLDALHNTLLEYAKISHSRPADYAAIDALLNTALLHFGASEAHSCISLLFNLQNLCVEERISSYTRQRALATIIVLHLERMADVLESEGLSLYMKRIRRGRIEGRMWCPEIIKGTYHMRQFARNELVIGGDLPASFDDLEITAREEHREPVGIWLSRESITNFIAIQCNPRDQLWSLLSQNQRLRRKRRDKAKKVKFTNNIGVEIGECQNERLMELSRKFERIALMDNDRQQLVF
ncbi:uncharacterized protein VTP21DRAFT_9239 [Calcarisporiella thermophila]|uniref:uncharacterized protein n=1 Tax=Calcarisporiella thermophila TaxID=911321 RepID=UPI0037437FB1